MLWIAAAVLTFLAALSVVLPFVRNIGDARETIEYDKAIYKARLVEIENDERLGRITQQEAKNAIAEEGRKLILLSENENNIADGSAKSGLTTKLAILVALVFIPASAMAIYLSFGNPDLPDQSLASRLQADPSQQSIAELISRAEAHLAKSPQDARGWAVLAPVYTRVGRIQDAVNAWANVYRLAPETPEIKATLAESMIALSQGVITAEARELFQKELVDNKASAKARFYLAMALGQEGKYQEAVAAWDELIRGGTSQSPWMEAAVSFRNEARKQAGLPEEETPGTVLSGPTKEDVEAASEMSSAERNEMISTMVANLAEKLAEDPSNKAGWQRLIQAYMVLGRNQDAQAAIEKALELHGEDTQFATKIRALQGALK